MSTDRVKKVRTPDYNYDFDRETGVFARWGKTLKDDPDYSVLGPEILDIEVSTICHGPLVQQHDGIFHVPCGHCYKSNTSKGENMSIETFQHILDVMPDNLTQIAFGIGDIDSNPDLQAMFKASRARNVVPNLTINGFRMSSKYYDMITKHCGAVAISHYGNTEVVKYNITQFHNRGMRQVNVHKMLCEDTYGECLQLIEDMENFKELNAIVFLLMKPKGKRNAFTQLRSMKKYRGLIEYAMERDVKIGFDSCSAPYFLEATKDHENHKLFTALAEPCESDLFSSYINVDGRFFHCSFTESKFGWKGVDVTSITDKKDFLENVWNAPEVIKFRESLTSQEGCRECPIYDLTIKEENESREHEETV